MTRPGSMRSLTRIPETRSAVVLMVRTSPTGSGVDDGRPVASWRSLPVRALSRTGHSDPAPRGGPSGRRAAPSSLQPGLAVLAELHPGLGGLALVSAEGAPVAQRHDFAVAGDVLVLAALVHAHRLVGEVDVDLLDLGVLCLLYTSDAADEEDSVDLG